MNFKVTCAELADKYLEGLKDRIARENAKPKLATIVFGDDKATALYMKNKSNACKRVGIEYEEYDFPWDVEPHKVSLLIHKLNGDPSVSGILIQKPCPATVEPFVNNIYRWKDVDGLSAYNVAMLSKGKNDEYHEPCTPMGVFDLLGENDIDVTGMHLVVIGRSDIVGKPLAMMGLKYDCTVTVCHSKTSKEDLRCLLYDADIVVSACGVPHLITRDMLGQAKYVIDCGMTKVDGKWYGDVEDLTEDSRIYATPVPNGVGKLTVAGLMWNVYSAWNYCKERG